MTRLSIVSLLTACLLLFFGCGSEPEKKETKENQPATQAAPQAPPALPVETVTASRQKIPIWVNYTGKTEASQQVEVRARVGGRLEAVHFKEGELVEAGQKLFTIEPASYQAAVEQARGQLERDQASLALAQADVERYRPLVAEGLAPRINLEQNQAKVAELQAAIKADEGALAKAELNLSYTEVTAPLSGKASRLLVDIGNVVGTGEQTVLTTIVADDPMYAYFNPSEEAFQLIQKYKSKDVLEARVTVPVKNTELLQRKPYSGVVDFNDNKVDKMTGTITMRATVANPERSLLEGTFVYIDLFITDQSEFLMLHPSALMEDQLGSYVYVAGDDNLAKRINIKRGFESRHYVLIAEGLSGGERVIVSALAKIRPGTPVAATDVTASKGVMAILEQNGLMPAKE